MSKLTKQVKEVGYTPRGKAAEAGVWNERMLTALGNGVHGGKWFSLLDKAYRAKTLELAWQEVASKRGAAGIDQISIARFEVNKEQYLNELHTALRTGRYEPQGVRRVYIPKGKQGTRPLGIPTVKDRIVQTALKWVLEPIFEHEFETMSHGFRPGRSCKSALREVNQLLQDGYHWVVDADLQSYFDSIPHEALMEHLSERISDGPLLKLLEAYLQQEILEGLHRWQPTQGTPQGAVLSPLLANIYLHPLDQLLTEQGYRAVRYADDFVILCPDRVTAKRALEVVKQWVASNGLNLHPDKTHLGHSPTAGQGFEFLGYRFEGGRRWVRKKSWMSLKDRVRSKTSRTRGDSMESIIADLNRSLRGWFAYFKHADRRTFRGVDGFVRRRLRAILRKQNKRPGQGQCYADHKRWPNAYFAERGLFTMHEAHVLASQSR